jgi:quinone-modifying oxidoreductase, subunit QmoB
MTHPVCIFGPPAGSREIADRLLSQGRNVLLVPDPAAKALPAGEAGRGAGLEVLPAARLLACTGAPGEFELSFAQRGSVLRRRASALVLAHPPERRPLYAAHGLRPDPVLLPAARLVEMGCRPPAGKAVREVAILNGLQRESTPQATGELLRAALRLRQETRARCHYFTRNLKVAADGLDALANEARAAGVVFHKFARSAPAITQGEDGRAHLTFTDEVTGLELRLSPDLLVVDEACEPSEVTRELTRTLQLETDAAGFPQADNVHRLPVFTNRRGVLVAGAALPGGAAGAADASNVLLALQPGSNPIAAEIDPGRCVRCLTCYRVCPYRAVTLAGRPVVQPTACEACGICRAECPRQAIRIEGQAPADLRTLIDAGRPPDGCRPFVVAFACARSAGPALRSAAAAGHRWGAHVNLIEVLCAGSLGQEVILAALEHGAAGVMVLTCHDDNCHSRTGNRLARSRVAQTQEFLERCGAAGRLVLKTTAANMEAELGRDLRQFATHLTAKSGPDRGPAG